MAKKSIGGLMVWLGLAFLGLLLVLFRGLSKTKNPQTGTNSASSKIFNTLLDAGFSERFAAIVTSQAAFETANFTSRLFIEQNNAFGMKDASGRANTQIAVKNDFGVYASVEDSAKDFVYWWKAANLPQYSSINEYITDIKTIGYFESPVNEYIGGVKRYFNEMFPNA